MSSIKDRIKRALNQSITSLKRHRIVVGNRKKIHNLKKGNTNLNGALSKEWNKKTHHFWYKKLGLKIKKDWHIAYSSVNGIIDEKYIPEDIFYSLIEPRLNYLPVQQAYSDKNFYSVIFPKIKEPNIILRNINGNYYSSDYKSLSSDEAETIVKSFLGSIVVKPTIDSGGGKNVQIFHCEKGILTKGNGKVTFQDIEGEYGKSNFIIQERLKQHRSLDDLYPHSLNSIRVITLRFDNEINVLSAVVRFGNNGTEVDNQHMGGLSCGINKRGDLNAFCIDKFGRKYSEHPYTKYCFNQGKIEHFQTLLDAVTELHRQLRYFNLVSWDMALDEKGTPVLIEINLSDQEINKHQFNNGPLFGNLTEQVFKKIIKIE